MSTSPSSKRPSKLLRNSLYFKNFTEEELKKLDEPFYPDLMLEIALARLNLARLELRYSILMKKKSPPAP
jgi:hypothetical protein